MKELSKLSIELEINFKMDILKVSKAKARKGGIKMNPRIENLKGKLIVSCQALPDEPLHSSFIMGRMALGAQQGTCFKSGRFIINAFNYTRRYI